MRREVSMVAKEPKLKWAKHHHVWWTSLGPNCVLTYYPVKTLDLDQAVVTLTVSGSEIWRLRMQPYGDLADTFAVVETITFKHLRRLFGPLLDAHDELAR